MPAEALRFLELARDLGRQGDYIGAVAAAQDALKAVPDTTQHPEVAAQAHHIIAWCSCLKFQRTTSAEFDHARHAVNLARRAEGAGAASTGYLHHVLADLIEVAARCDQLEVAAEWARELAHPETHLRCKGGQTWPGLNISK